MARLVDIECSAVTEVIGRRAFTSRADIQEFLDNIPTYDIKQLEQEMARNIINECRYILSRLLNGEIKCYEFNVELRELMEKYGVED